MVADNGWFAARPSGTEDVYKIYAESFESAAHLQQIQAEAQDAIGRVFRAKPHEHQGQTVQVSVRRKPDPPAY